MTEQHEIPLRDAPPLRCEEVVRELRGRRRVCRGEWQGRPVFAKLYLDPRRAELHRRRELRGIEALASRGIPTVELLFSGHSAAGAPLMILSAIPDPLPLSEAWGQADPVERSRLLDRVTALLARHHRAGVVQTDLHPGNLVLSGGEILTLDGAGIIALRGEVDRDRSLENLALLVVQFHLGLEPEFSRLLSAYTAARGWPEPVELKDFERFVKRARKRRWRKYREKLFRDCSRIVARHAPQERLLATRAELTPALERLLDDPDATLEGGEMLKDGNTCTVWATPEGYVVKRYNPLGVWHGVKQRARRSRGERSWENAHRLAFLGVATAAPLALLIRRRGIRQTAWLVLRRIEGRPASELFTDPAVESEERRARAEAVAGILLTLRSQRIVHGDMKAANILFRDGVPHLIDLDAMRSYLGPRRFGRAWRRDIHRLLRNWDGLPEVHGLFMEVLEEAGIIDYVGD